MVDNSRRFGAYRRTEPKGSIVMNAGEALRIVRDRYISKPESWKQGPGSKDPDCGCLVVDIWRATGAANPHTYDHGSRVWAQKFLADTIGRSEPSELSSQTIIRFNDAPGRTVEQVVAVLNKAIELAETVPPHWNVSCFFDGWLRTEGTYYDRGEAEARYIEAVREWSADGSAVTLTDRTGALLRERRVAPSQQGMFPVSEALRTDPEAAP